MEPKNILLFTPGLDSFLSSYFLEIKGINFHRYYVNLHTRYSENEIKFIRSIYGDGNEVRILDNYLNLYEIEDSTTYHVPNRNALICMLVQAVTGTSHLYLNGVLDDNVSDNNSRFYDLMSKVLTQCNGRPVTVSSPLWGKEKSEWVRKYVDTISLSSNTVSAMEKNNDLLDKKIKLIKNTYSCFSDQWVQEHHPLYLKMDETYVPSGTVEFVGCMECAACFRKFCALTSIDIYVPFKNIDLVIYYKNRKDLQYNLHRYKTIINYSKFNQIFYGDSYLEREVSVL